MSKPPPLPSVEALLFEEPLYAKYELAEDLEDVRILYGFVATLEKDYTVDAFCPYCERATTFRIPGISITRGAEWNNIRERFAYDCMEIICTRVKRHKIRYWFRVDCMTVMKVGQYPSLADIAIEETRQKYSAVLRGENWSEFYKAIGLAAHGEGIGSFVYLRRVFERLIKSRFNEFKQIEGWEETSFDRLRMDEKIKFLNGHLPQYLVSNRKIYSIFSAGLHDLSNEECLRFFEIGKRTIIVILEEDLKKHNELCARKELSEAIAKFSP